MACAVFSRNANFKIPRGIIYFFSEGKHGKRNVASESFLAVPTVSNLQETDTVLSLNHMSLFTSVEAMSCGGEDEEFNLDTLRAINDVISTPSSVNNETPGVNVYNTSSQAMQQSTTSKKGQNSRSKNSKKASQEGSSINLQPTQSSLAVLTPAQDVMVPATPYVPNQHANGLYFPNQQFNNVVPTIQAQSRPLASLTPSCSSMTGMQLAEIMLNLIT